MAMNITISPSRTLAVTLSIVSAFIGLMMLIGVADDPDTSAIALTLWGLGTLVFMAPLVVMLSPQGRRRRRSHSITISGDTLIAPLNWPPYDDGVWHRTTPPDTRYRVALGDLYPFEIYTAGDTFYAVAPLRPGADYAADLPLVDIDDVMHISIPLTRFAGHERLVAALNRAVSEASGSGTACTRTPGASTAMDGYDGPMPGHIIFRGNVTGYLIIALIMAVTFYTCVQELFMRQGGYWGTFTTIAMWIAFPITGLLAVTFVRLAIKRRFGRRVTLEASALTAPFKVITGSQAPDRLPEQWSTLDLHTVTEFTLITNTKTTLLTTRCPGSDIDGIIAIDGDAVTDKALFMAAVNSHTIKPKDGITVIEKSTVPDALKN